VKLEVVRDAMVELGRFTAPELAVHLGVTPPTIRPAIEWAIERGIVVEADLQRTGRRGRPARVFVHAPLPPGPRSKPRSPDVMAIARSGSGPSGRKQRGISKEVAAVLAEARAAGATIRPGAHPKIVMPNGERIIAAGTPSDHRTVRNLRAQIRRAAQGSAQKGRTDG
jgi:hypothetical protein